MSVHLPRSARRPRHPARGAVLVEFALVSLALYLLLAGGIEFGRLMFAANALQDVARLAAREMAVAPLRADATFDDALTCSPAAAGCLANLRRRVFDPACLVVDLSDPAVAPDIDGYFAAMPVVNRALRPLFISEAAQGLLRYPGALLADASGGACSAVGPNGVANATGLTVGIPLVAARDETGAETITWVPVLEEIRAAAYRDCPARGSFSLLYQPALDDCGPLAVDPAPVRGVAAVRVNYPFQAAMLSAFRPSVPTFDDPLPPNGANPIAASDDAVLELNAAPGEPVGSASPVGPYAGRYGLGRQLALAGREVRPFRRVVSAQAIFRREVFQ